MLAHGDLRSSLKCTEVILYYGASCCLYSLFFILYFTFFVLFWLIFFLYFIKICFIFQCCYYRYLVLKDCTYTNVLFELQCFPIYNSCAVFIWNLFSSRLLNAVVLTVLYLHSCFAFIHLFSQILSFLLLCIYIGFNSTNTFSCFV